MSKIKQINAREILNAKGDPTVEATVVLEDGSTGVGSSPTGTSIGKYEAIEIKDNDSDRFGGQGSLKACENVEKIIAHRLLNMDATSQNEVDRAMIELDGTINKNRLGTNAMLSVSIAVAKAAAKSLKMPLFLYLHQYVKKDDSQIKIPTPAFNIINGGRHANDNLSFQEFLVIPATYKTFSQSLVLAYSVYHSLKGLLETANASTLVGDEGGFGPTFPTNQDALNMLKQAVETSKYRLNYDVFFGLDIASNSFYQQGKYNLKDTASALSTDELVTFYKKLNEDFSFLYLEDPFGEDDWDGWVKLMGALSGKTIIVGDDLIATNPYRLQMALDKKAITGVIIKPNQIGTVIESLALVEVAKQFNLKVIVSHRSGETNDDFIADFAVAAGADYVKFGAPVRGERIAKYNRLLEIEKWISTSSA